MSGKSRGAVVTPRLSLGVARSGRGGTSESSGSRTGPEVCRVCTVVIDWVRAPSGNRPALRAGNRNFLARLRRAAASSDWSLLIVKGGRASLSHFPPDTQTANKVRCRQFFVVTGCRQGNADLRPVAVKMQSCGDARPRDGAVGQGTPTSGRHSPPKAGGIAYGRALPWWTAGPTPAFDDGPLRPGVPESGSQAENGIVPVDGLAPFAALPGSGADRRSAFPCLCATAPAGVRPTVGLSRLFHDRRGVQADPIMASSPGGGRHSGARRRGRRGRRVASWFGFRP